MNFSQRLRRNRFIDCRDPEFDEDLGAMSEEDIENALEYEAEQKLEEMDGNY